MNLTWVVIVSTGLFTSQHSCGLYFLMGHAVCVNRPAQTRIILMTFFDGAELLRV